MLLLISIPLFPAVVRYSFIPNTLQVGWVQAREHTIRGTYQRVPRQSMIIRYLIVELLTGRESGISLKTQLAAVTNGI